MSAAVFEKVARKGQFFRPATDAYESARGLYVDCDRCKTTHLPACLHLGTTDLCLPCAHTLLITGTGVCETPASPAPTLPTPRPTSAGGGRRFA